MAVGCFGEEYGTWTVLDVVAPEMFVGGAATLKALAHNIDYGKMREPSFMMVLTAIGQFAYSHEDGVMVVPIGCLRP